LEKRVQISLYKLPKFQKVRNEKLMQCVKLATSRMSIRKQQMYIGLGGFSPTF